VTGCWESFVNPLKARTCFDAQSTFRLQTFVRNLLPENKASLKLSLTAWRALSPFSPIHHISRISSKPSSLETHNQRCYYKEGFNISECAQKAAWQAVRTIMSKSLDILML